MTENNIDNDSSKDSKDLKAIDITRYPITTNTFTWTLGASILYLLLFVLSVMVPFTMIITFHVSALLSNLIHWRIAFIFIDILAWWGLYILMTLFVGKLFLIILNLLHKPKEGLFKIDKKDKDFSFYCYRIAVKKYIFWVYNNFCFPWASNLAFKYCNICPSLKSTMFDGWSDLEFIEYGDNVMLGQGAVVLSSMIIGDHILFKKVIIGDHSVIGGNAIVAPGTIIGAKTTVGVWATTHIGQVLEPGWIYIGRPARKYKPAVKMAEDSRKQAIRRIVDTNERIPLEVRRYIKKDVVDIAVEKLDKLYEKWKEEEDVRSDKELKKKYKKEKKKIKRTII
jgi:hypothetical protein